MPSYRNWTCPECCTGNFSGPVPGVLVSWVLRCCRCGGTGYAVPLDGARGAWLVLVPDPLLRRAW